LGLRDVWLVAELTKRARGSTGGILNWEKGMLCIGEVECAGMASWVWCVLGDDISFTNE
jgi:hypothetical protein